MLVNDTTGICMLAPATVKNVTCPVPSGRMCVDASRHPIGNKVSWNVVSCTT